MRLWGKIYKNNRLINHEEAICNGDDYQENLKKCITEICQKLNIQKPYWLPKNMEEYNRYSKTSFKQDNFIEEVDFDYFEIIELEN